MCSRARGTRRIKHGAPATPEPIKDWWLTTLKERLIKIGTKVVGHACYLALDHPPDKVDVKLVIQDYAQARSTQGPVYYYGTISNLGTESVTARMLGVYFPEFQSDWEM